VPFAHYNLVKLPDAISDDQAILLSDIFPTGYFGAQNAEIKPGNTVAVFGCGPVGQFAIASAWMLGAQRVLAVDCLPDRLEMARSQGAEAIDFGAEDPVAMIHQLTGGIGVDRVIDAVGVDAVSQQGQPEQVRAVAPETNPQGPNWQPGNAPSQVLTWGVEAVCKAGTVSIIGVYPPAAQSFPIGAAMQKNLTLKMGNCNHRTLIPILIDAVVSGRCDPVKVLTQREPMTDVIAAYKAFDTRQPGWVKVALKQAA
jgi:threonine dehydrogenase-like Zn-dependent dehydrogenase